MTVPETRRFSPAALEEFCVDLLVGAGINPPAARSLARATVGAERRGKPRVGMRHLIDYVDAAAHGGLHGAATPVRRPGPRAVISVDADGGLAQYAFDLHVAEFVETATDFGVGVLALTNAYTTGELGHYTRRLASDRLIAIAVGNSPALMSVYGSRAPLTGTNPMSFAYPLRSGVRAFDQATSTTAWVTVRDAALRSESIPLGWAVDADGEATTDAEAGLRGALLPFGDVKGSNLAVMIELLATRAGGSFSVDAAGSDTPERSPALGLWILAELSRFGRPRPEADHIDVPAAVLNELHRAVADARR